MDSQKGNVAGVAAVGPETVTLPNGSNINGGTAIDAGYTSANLATVAAMRSRLAALQATHYTAAKLNTLSFNDMVYAIRVLDAPTSVG